MGFPILTEAARAAAANRSATASSLRISTDLFRNLLSRSTALTRMTPAVLCLMLAAPGVANAAPIELAGKYIRVTVNDKGTLGSGSTPPGIQYDGTGTGTFNDAYDYLTPGTPYEGFTVVGVGSGGAFKASNKNSEAGPGVMIGTASDYSGVEYNGETYDQRAVWTGTYTGVFDIVNDYYFNDGEQQLKIATTITALEDLTGLAFARFLDPDARAASGDSSVTNNFRGAGSVSENDLVYAEALVSKYVIGLFTNSTITHNTGVTYPWKDDPSFYLAGENHGNGDAVIGLAFAIGALNTGDSVTLTYQYIFGTDIEKAVEESGAGPSNITGGKSYSPDDLAQGKVNPVFEGGTLEFDATVTEMDTDLTLSTGGGTVDTDDASTALLRGDITGTGGLTKTGGGVLILTGDNDYAGGTTIEDGYLVGSTSSVPGDVTVNGGWFILDQDHDGTFGGEISGSGGFVKDGPGTVVLTGNNSHSGGTVVSGGTLVADTDSIGSGDVHNDATLVFQQEDDATFNGAIDGDGKFVKSGQGTLNLGPDAEFHNPEVEIQEGRLAINTEMGSSTVDVVGGTVGGNGVVGGLIVRTDATAAPGNSIGTLTSATYVHFEPDSFYEVEVDAAGNNDRIVASGEALIEGGTVRVIAENGDYAPATDYVILTAEGGVTGSFANAESNLAFLSPVLNYDATRVILTLYRNDQTFAGVAATANQRAAGRAVDGVFGVESDVYLGLLGGSVAEVRRGLDRLSGEIHASALTAAAQDADLVRRAILDQGRSTRSGNGIFWAQAIGSWSDLDGNGNAGDLDHSSYGLIGGASLSVAEGFEVGIALGYTEGDVKSVARGADGDMESKHVAVYGSGSIHGVTLRAGAGYSAFNVDMDRTVAFRGFSERLRAKYDGAVSQLFAEAAYGFTCGKLAIEPFAGIAAMWVSKDGFTETGGSAALRDRGDGDDFAWASLGARLHAGFDWKLPVTVHANAAWQHMVGGRMPYATLTFVEGGNAFKVAGTPFEKDSFAVGGGFDVKLTETVTLGASYGGNFSDRRNDHAGRINLTVGF